MKPVTINYVKKDKDGETVLFSGSVTLNAPEDAAEFSRTWGDDVLYNKAMDQIIIDARRLCYAAEGDNEKAQEAVNTWTPGVNRRAPGGVSKKALFDAFNALSDEEKKAFFARLTSSGA